MKHRILTLVLLIVTLFATQSMQAQAPVDSPEQAITGLLNRIGGSGAAVACSESDNLHDLQFFHFRWSQFCRFCGIPLRQKP